LPSGRRLRLGAFSYLARRREAAETATGFKKEIRLGGPHSPQGARALAP
jgi:hypothetical protein